MGAAIQYSDDGAQWSNRDFVPAGFNSSSADFAMGVSKGGYVVVGWFDRDSSDVLVVMKNPAGAWGPLTDISARASKGQDYGPRFATDPAGGLRLVGMAATSSVP